MNTEAVRVADAYEQMRYTRRQRVDYGRSHAEVGPRYEALVGREQAAQAELMSACESLVRAVDRALVAAPDGTVAQSALWSRAQTISTLRAQLAVAEGLHVRLHDALEALALLRADDAALRAQGEALAAQVLRATDDGAAVEQARKAREQIGAQQLQLTRLEAGLRELRAGVLAPPEEGAVMPFLLAQVDALIAGCEPPRTTAHMGLSLLVKAGYLAAEQLGPQDETARMLTWALDQFGGHLALWPGEQGALPNVGDELEALRVLETAVRSDQPTDAVLRILEALRTPAALRLT